MHKDFQLWIEPCANAMERYYLRFWLQSAANLSPPSKFSSANWLSTKHPSCQSSQCGKPIQMGSDTKLKDASPKHEWGTEKKKACVFVSSLVIKANDGRLAHWESLKQWLTGRSGSQSVMCGTSSRTAPPAPFTILLGSKSIDMITISFLSRFFNIVLNDAIDYLASSSSSSSLQLRCERRTRTDLPRTELPTLARFLLPPPPPLLAWPNETDAHKKKLFFSFQTTHLPCCVSSVRNSSTSSTGSPGNDGWSWKNKKRKVNN